jgi:hypothetical protein
MLFGPFVQKPGLNGFEVIAVLAEFLQGFANTAVSN